MNIDRCICKVTLKLYFFFLIFCTQFHKLQPTLPNDVDDDTDDDVDLMETDEDSEENYFLENDVPEME